MSVEQGRGTAASSGFIDDLNGAIRENPVSAGLVSLGLAWLFFGNSKLTTLGGQLPGVARNVTGAIGSALNATGHTLGDGLAAARTRVAAAGSQVGETARQLGEAGTENVTFLARNTLAAGQDALASAGDTLVRAAGTIENTGKAQTREFQSVLQQNLSQTLERQPLLLGAIGLAIGVGIASAFPSTALEKEMLGEAGDALKGKVQGLVTEATDRAKQVVEDAKSEAATQGLTLEGTKEVLKGISDKAKNAATASGEAVKARLS